MSEEGSESEGEEAGDGDMYDDDEVQPGGEEAQDTYLQLQLAQVTKTRAQRGGPDARDVVGIPLGVVMEVGLKRRTSSRLYVLVRRDGVSTTPPYMTEWVALDDLRKTRRGALAWQAFLQDAGYDDVPPYDALRARLVETG